MAVPTKLKSSRRTSMATPPPGLDLKKHSSVGTPGTCTPNIGTPTQDGATERKASHTPDFTRSGSNGQDDRGYETGDEDKVYGLDGGVIGRLQGTAGVTRTENAAPNSKAGSSLEDKTDSAASEEVRGGGIEREGARGIPVAIPPPSLNLLRTLQEQIGTLGNPFGTGSKSPLGSLEKWGRRWFNGRERSSRNPGPQLANCDEEEEEADDTDGMDGFALVKDHWGTAGSPSKESINGSGSGRNITLGGHLSSTTVFRRSEMMEFDFGDGKGSQPGLFEFHPSETIGFRIWDCGSVGEAGLEGLADIKESLVWDSGPKEVVCFEAVRGQWILDAVLTVAKGQAKASLIQLVLSAVDDRGNGNIRIEIVEPESGRVKIKHECGKARLGRLSVSNKLLAVTLGGDRPSTVVYHRDTLRPYCRPIEQDLGINTRSGLPVAALQGRLLAYVTSEPVKPNSERYAQMEEFKYGTIVTKRSVKAAMDWQGRQREEKAASSPPSESRFSPESLPSMQAMVLSTAAGISSEVAKGVWSGLKGFGRAAIDGASRSEALSKSAPVVSDLAKRFASESTGRDQTVLNNQRSFSGHASAKDCPESSNGSPRKRYDGSSWIKIVDLGHLVKSRRATGLGEETHNYRPVLIAHFAVPVLDNVTLPGHDLAAVDLLSFSHDGTHLAIANADGKTVSIVEIRLSTSVSATDSNRPSGQVWLRHDLRRGVMPARIIQVAWNRMGSTISVASRKTIHVFEIGTDADSDRAAERGSSPRGLSIKSPAALKIRTSDWAEPDPNNQVRPSSKGNSTLCFLSAASDKTVQAESSIVLYDSCQRLVGKVSIFKLAKRPSEQREELLPITTALWRVPEQPESGTIKRQIKRNGGIEGQLGTTRHPFSQVEVVTFSATRSPSSIYKDRMFAFSVAISGTFARTQPVQYRKQVEISGDPNPQHSIQSALAHDLDPSQAPPMIPALPNGLNGHGKPHWRVQPISVMASAVKGHHRQRPKYAAIGKPNSYSGTPGQDSGSGFLVDVREDEDASPPGSVEESQESWEDDLIAGAMDV